jgi:hypothetical protein
LALVGCAAASAFAQSVYVYGAVNYGATPAPACQTGGCPPAAVQPAPVARPVAAYRTPTVIYVGAGSGYPRPNYYSGWGYGPGYSSFYAPNVIPFGVGQAYVHGYAFRHCR